MGFFSDMRSINKIYKQLNLIETDMTQMQKCLSGILSRSLFDQTSSLGLVHLQELVEMVNEGGSTIQHADSEFCGLKRPIRHHMVTLGEYMKDMMTQYLQS